MTITSLCRVRTLPPSRYIFVKNFCWNMAFFVFKISSILIAFLFLCGLQVDCKVERYAFNIVENGTSVNEEVEVDADEQTEVIRVPKHNNVDALELMNDFIAGLSVRRDPEIKVCYVSKLDSSFPSPGEMKLDMDQASRQSALPDEVITKRSALRVVGFADRLALPQKILKFCGTFPIYEVEIEEIPSYVSNTTLAGRVRGKRNHLRWFYELCSHGERPKLDACLKKVGHETLMNNHYQCTHKRIYCFYMATCKHQGPYNSIHDYECHKVYHFVNYNGRCCTVTNC